MRLYDDTDLLIARVVILYCILDCKCELEAVCLACTTSHNWSEKLVFLLLVAQFPVFYYDFLYILQLYEIEFLKLTCPFLKGIESDAKKMGK